MIENGNCFLCGSKETNEIVFLVSPEGKLQAHLKCSYCSPKEEQICDVCETGEFELIPVTTKLGEFLFFVCERCDKELGEE